MLNVLIIRKQCLLVVTDNKGYIKIWEKVNNLMNIEFDSEPVYGDNDKYIKTKIYDNKVNTNFQGKEVPKENASYDCLPLIMLDSVIRVNKEYCPQTFLEECKYKRNKRNNFMTDELEPDTTSESDNESESD